MKSSKTTPLYRKCRKKRNPELEAIIQALDDKKATEVVVLDVDAVSSVARYFVITTATSHPHLNALRGALEDIWREKFNRRIKCESHHGTAWQVVDMGDILVHLFTAEARTRYNLEGLWGDARQLKLSA